MTTIESLSRLFGTLVLSVALVGCSENDGPSSTEEGDVVGKFVIAATASGSGTSTSVLLTADSLDGGEISAEGNGLSNKGATQWVFHGENYLYGLTYNQGNQGNTRSYVLGRDGNMKVRDIEYNISRFSSYGTYKNYIIPMSTGDGPAEMSDANGYLPKTLLLTYLDVENENKRSNDTSTGAYSMEDFLGNGEYVTLSGAEQSGNRIVCGAVPMGLSQYGHAADASYVRPGYDRLVKEADGGSNSGAYKKGEIIGTQYPNDCWVAIFSDETMTKYTLAHTDQLSYPCGRFRSQYYQTVWAAENGDIYVFSSSYAKTMTDPLQKTDRDAGVMRIPAGSSDFDNYYCSIEDQTDGKSFMRCWPAGGNYFLMVMYDKPFTESGYAANDLAIFNADAKKVTYVTGLPSDIASFGKNVFVQNGYVYIPISVTDGYPAIYRIDPSTGKAEKGLTVIADEINGFGYMKSL